MNFSERERLFPARHNGRDDELERLRRERDRLREELQETRARFRKFTQASGKFAASMRGRMSERRRLDLQHAVFNALEPATLDEIPRKALEVLGAGLGQSLGVFWIARENTLCCAGIWRSSGATCDALEEACRSRSFSRGSGLPGCAWAEARPVRAGDLGWSPSDPRLEIAARSGLRGAVAFPIQGSGGRLIGVAEFFGQGIEAPDEGLIRTLTILGSQVAQVIEHKRAEEALRRSEEQLQLALDASAMGTFTWYPEEDRCEADARMCELFGLPENGTLNLAVALETMIHPDDRERYAQAVGRATDPTGSGELHEDIRVIHSDGAQHWLTVMGRTYFEDRSPNRMVGTTVDITERKRSEEALRESEARLQRALAIDTVGVLFFNLDGNITEANEAFTRMSGYSREELLDMPDWEVLTCPEFREVTRRAAREIAETGETAPYEKQLVRKDGSRWWGLFAPTRIGGSGAQSECVEFVIDTTESKRAVEALRESEERFRAVANLVPDLLWSTDVEGKVVRSNQRWLEYTGQTVEEAQQWGWLYAVHPDDREETRRAFESAFASGQGLEHIHRIRRHDGEYRWFLVRHVTQRDAEGHILRWFGAATDIHEQRTALDALRESEERYRALFELGPIARFTCDRNGAVQDYNRRAVELWGCKPKCGDANERYCGLLRLYHPDGRLLPHKENPIVEVLRTGSPIQGAEVLIERPDGSRIPMIVSCSPLRDKEGRISGAIASFLDITKHKRLEEERERLRIQERVARAAVAERERISRELHDRVAHEMGIVHQSLQLYEAVSPSDPERAGEKIQVAKKMAKAALESTRNLSAELRHSDAEEGLERALRDFIEAVTPPEMELAFSFDGDESFLPGHIRGQLYLVLCEAIRNAVRHSRCRTVNVGVEILPTGISASVEDDGLGFEADGKEYEGVGLRSMRERARLLGGELHLNPAPGDGTKVRVVIPLREEHP